MYIGMSASLEIEITEKLIKDYAEMTGDYNPIHLDPEFAATTTFKKCIAHGAILNGLFSKLAGTKLPGPGSTVLSAEFNYKAPAYVGDTVTATLTIKRYRKDKPIIFVECAAHNQDKAVLVSGNAVIYKFTGKPEQIKLQQL